MFTDNAVLQRGSETMAAVYGAVFGGISSQTTVAVTVAEAGQAPYTVQARVMVDTAPFNATWKALLKPHAAPGGDITITVRCANCQNTTASSIRNVTYGQVWVCSGQSNCWLPLEYTTTRNRSFAAADAGNYSNIRFYNHDTVAALDGEVPYVIAQETNPASTTNVWRQANSTWMNSFSAMCWYMAQEATDYARDFNEPVEPIGLIETAWGGTQIETWIRNDTIPTCKNVTGQPIVNRAQGWCGWGDGPLRFALSKLVPHPKKKATARCSTA